MKSAIYLNEGITQVVPTPENDWEKNAIRMIHSSTVGSDLSIYKGGFYDCQGGWTRHVAYHGPESHDSLTFKISKPMALPK